MPAAMPFAFPAPSMPGDPLGGIAAAGVNPINPLGSMNDEQTIPGGPPNIAPEQDVAELGLTPTLDTAELDGAAPARPFERTPEDLAAFTAGWWTRTSNTPEWERFTQQYRRDTATLLGMPAGAECTDDQLLKVDASKVTTQHVFRNGVMSVALTMPRLPELMIEPKRGVPKVLPSGTAVPFGAPAIVDPMADPLAGAMPGAMPGTPTAPMDTDGIKPEDQAFALTCDALMNELLEEGDALEALRDFVQDGFHYEIAWVKTTFQDRYDSDLMQEDRLPDSQDNIARARMLSELFAKGEFDRMDARYRELSLLLQSVQEQTEVEQERGLVIECIPGTMVRVDGRVRRPGDWHRAAWICHDALFTRDEVLARYREIDPKDLERAIVYRADGTTQAKDVAAQQGVNDLRPVNAQVPGGTDTRTAFNDWDLLLVREIHARYLSKVITLVEGLPYPARMQPIKKACRRWYQMRPLVLNPAPTGARRLAGLSNTELQSKLQDELNRLRGDRARATRASEPRYLYDKDVIEDDLTSKLSDLQPHGAVGVSFKGKDLRQSFIPLMGSGQINPELYRLDDTRSDMRSQSGIPESLTGSVGTSNFASENNTAAEGANILADYYQSRISEALDDVMRMGLEIVVQNMTATEVEDRIPGAYWPIDPNDRWSIYKRMRVKIRTSVNGDAHRKRALDGMKLVQETALAQNEPLDTDELLTVIARLVQLPIDIDSLIKVDPNRAAMKLMQAIAQNPNLDPQVAIQLEQMLAPLVQNAVIQVANGAGAPGGGPGGAVAGGGPARGGAPADAASGSDPIDAGGGGEQLSSTQPSPFGA
jgi:hypothetical protein